MVNIGGICEFDWQCRKSKFGNVCDHDHGLCSCNPGYIKTDRKCYPGKKKNFFFILMMNIIHRKIGSIHVHILFLEIGHNFFSFLLFKSYVFMTKGCLYIFS